MIHIGIYGKGTGIVIPITQTQLWECEGNRESSYEKTIAVVSQQFFFENRLRVEKSVCEMFDAFLWLRSPKNKRFGD